MFDFDLTEEQHHIKEEVARFAKEQLRERFREAEEDGVPDGLRQAFHRLGIPLLEVPEELGGVGLDSVTRVIVAEELAFGDVGIAMALEGPGAAGLALMEMGRPEQQRQWLAPFAEPDGWGKLAALAVAEDDLAAESGQIVTTWQPTGDGFRLRGHKRFVLHAGAAETAWYLVAARLDGLTSRPVTELPADLRFFVVPADATGLTVEAGPHRLGLQTAAIGQLRLDGVQVPATAMLNGAAQPPVAWRRARARRQVWNGARAVGVGRAGTEHAAEYAQERDAFGRKIGQFQSIAFMIAEGAMGLDSARWMLWEAAWKLDQGVQGAVRAAALAAQQAFEAAGRATIDNIQVMGGQGFMRDYPAEKWMRDARTLANLTGHKALLDLAAAGMGKER